MKEEHVSKSVALALARFWTRVAELQDSPEKQALGKPLVGNIDAEAWVDSWMATIADHPAIPYDRAAMIGWFANAIMAGYDRASQIARKAIKSNG